MKRQFLQFAAFSILTAGAIHVDAGTPTAEMQQRRRRVAVLVEVLGEAAFAAGEVDEADFLIRLWVLVPIILHSRVALE